MALTKTDIGAYIHNVGVSGELGTGAFTSGSFTPPAGALLVVIVNLATYDTDLAANYVLSGGGLTWTKQDTEIHIESGDDGAIQQIWTAPNATGSSMTVSSTRTGVSSYGGTMLIWAFTGYDTSTPVGAIASSQATTDSITLTLPSAPASDSYVVAGINIPSGTGNGTGATVAPNGTGWVESFETSTSVSEVYTKSQGQTRTGSTSTSVGWSTTTNGGAGFNTRMYSAIEIKAAAAAGAARSWGFIIG